MSFFLFIKGKYKITYVRIGYLGSFHMYTCTSKGSCRRTFSTNVPRTRSHRSRTLYTSRGLYLKVIEALECLRKVSRRLPHAVVEYVRQKSRRFVLDINKERTRSGGQ